MLLLTIFDQNSDCSPVVFQDNKQGLSKAIAWLNEAKADNRHCLIDVRRVFDGYMTAFIGTFGKDEIAALEELLALA